VFILIFIFVFIVIVHDVVEMGVCNERKVFFAAVAVFLVGEGGEAVLPGGNGRPIAWGDDVAPISFLLYCCWGWLRCGRCLSNLCVCCLRIDSRLGYLVLLLGLPFGQRSSTLWRWGRSC